MNTVSIKDLNKNIDKKVMISGHIESIRNHGKLIFFDLREDVYKVQIIVYKESDAFDDAQTITTESAIVLQGIVKKRKNLKKETNTIEDIEVITEVIENIYLADTLPFDMSADINIDTNFDYRPLTLRRIRERNIFKFQSQLIVAFREYFLSKDFVEFQSPKIIGADAEGGADVFKIDYFKKNAYLATSPQFYKQIMVPVFKKVFSIGAVFRAEKHATTRHTNEYTGIDAEIGFIKSYIDICIIFEEMIRYVCNKISHEEIGILNYFNMKPPKIPDSGIPIISLQEVHTILKTKYQNIPEKENDLAPKEERMISKYILEKYDSDFVFVSKYPVSKRPFYSFRNKENPLLTDSFDVLFRGLEISTAGQRIHLVNDLKKSIEEKGLDPKNYDFYMQAFKYGCPPHGGFGIGLERVTALFLGLSNIKEATLFPRDLHRIDNKL